MHKQHIPCIFIADDNPNNLKVLSAMLESKGYDTRLALNGEQALASIRQAPPDLILLDIHMPKMDGYEVCEALKKDEDLKDIRVIFISALTESFNKIQGFRLGAVDYIEKPFQVEEVEVRVETQLQLRLYQQHLKEKAAFSEKRLALAAEAGNIGVWEWQGDTDTLLWDERMFNIHGMDKQDFIEKSASWFDIVHKDDRSKVENEVKCSLSEKKMLQTEFRTVMPDRSIKYIYVKAAVYQTENDSRKKMIGVALDITNRVMAEKNRKKMADRLHRARKMESLGNMAGGVAHDFNNILFGILGHSELAEKFISEPEKAKIHIHEIINGAHRAAKLVRQMQMFSRKQICQKQPLRMGPLIKEVINLLLPSIPETIEIEDNLSSDAMVLADPTQMHQVVMNLCINAHHAMLESGGTLSITLDDIEITQPCEFRSPELKPGSYIRLEVKDTGKGMTKAVLDRIFEPYFTTKEPNEGTGLGLAVVHGIVEEHNGMIKVESREGAGSLFHVFLPVMEKDE